MTQPESAILIAEWIGANANAGKNPQRYEVQYNPKELSLEKGIQLAEINIPGLDAPLQQFIRGQAEKLSLELFFDTTENGMGDDAVSVTTETDEIYKLVKVESSSHAPPVVTFCWNEHFSGDTLSAEGTSNQLRNSFKGVAESVKQNFTLFSPKGVPLRATINLVLREYRTLEEQLHQLKLNSPDRSHSHVLQDGDELSRIAQVYYESPYRWRAIADEPINRIEDPRRLRAGSVFTVPAILTRFSA
ncbi:MAG: hypothetical protein WD397_17270 [Wenzhouxiangellaceae bacterium]